LDKLLKAIDKWKTLIASIGLLLAGFFALKQEILKWDPHAWSLPEIGFALLVLVTFIFIWLRNRSVNASRLLDPEAFRLDPKSPHHLVGREEHLEKLLNVLDSNRLVFLVSESGCGKTALLRAGIARSIAVNQWALPIYVDLSVLDWERGPLRALSGGFSRA